MKKKIDLRILTKSLKYVLRHQVVSKFLNDRNAHSNTSIKDIHSKILGEKAGIIYIQHKFNFELINEFVASNEDLLVGVLFDRKHKKKALIYRN